MSLLKMTVCLLKMRYVKLTTKLAIWDVRRRKLKIPKGEQETWSRVVQIFELYKKETEYQLEQYCEIYCSQIERSIAEDRNGKI